MLGQLATRGVFRRGQERQVVEEWSTKLQIATPTIDTPVRRLSGGSQQKVLIARWLAAGATVLLLEEPTRGVDIATKAEIYRLLRQRAGEGSAILITSSDLEEVVTVADRVLVARRGLIVAELPGATQEAVASAALENVGTEEDTQRGA
jgi:ABC-type sugar transport system ATPase subunit